jgi:hypothetical protein
MIQLRSFSLPDQEQEANDFLRTHKPAGPISFNADKAFVFYEDGTNPAEYQIADLNELLQSVQNAKFQQEIALHTMEYERADLNPKHNKNRYDEVTSAIVQTQHAINLQDAKAGFLRERIDALRQPAPSNNGENAGA